MGIFQQRRLISLIGGDGDALAGSRGLGRLGGILFGVLILTSGCITLDPDRDESRAPPPPSQASAMQAAWVNHVVLAPDPVHQGKPVPCLVGRLFLWGPEEKFPITGDGSLLVMVYRETPDGWKYLNGWKIDPLSLKRYIHKDIVGWGYSLGLPWPEYHGELGAVRIACRYEPKKGEASVCEAQVTLAKENKDAIPQQQTWPTAEQLKPK